MPPADALRALLARPGLLVAPGVYDGLSARLLAAAGFEAAYATGFGAAASRLGLPDLGLLSFKEMLDHVAALADVLPVPLLADADTGYGDALNVQRTVRSYARAGAAAVQIEDQVWPKRCGHTRGKAVVPAGEAVGRVKAAVDAAGGGILVIARTDARAVEGLDRALDRCRAFAAAGADLVFLEAPESEAELARAATEAGAPLLVNLIEGGRTPLVDRARLEELGGKVAIYPLTLLFAAAAAVRAQLEDGLRPWAGEPGFGALQAVLGFAEHDRRREEYAGGGEGPRPRPA